MIFEKIIEVEEKLGKTKIEDVASGIKGLFTSQFTKDDMIAFENYNDAYSKLVEQAKAAGRSIDDVRLTQEQTNNIMKNASKNAQNYANSLNGLSINMKNVSTASKAMQALSKGFSMLKGIGVGLAVSYVISGLIENIVKWKNEEKDKIESANKEIKQEIENLEESIEKHEELISTYEDEIDSLNDLQDKIKETRNSKKGLLTLEEEIHKYIGYTISDLSSTSDAYSKVTSEIQAQITEKEKLLEIEKEYARQQNQNKYKINTITNEGGKDVTMTDLLQYSLVKSNGEKIVLEDYYKDVLTKYDKQGKDIGNEEVAAEALREALSYFRHMAEVGENEISTNEILAFGKTIEQDLEKKNKTYANLSDEMQSLYFANALSGLKSKGKQLSSENIYSELLIQLQDAGIQITDDINQFVNDRLEALGISSDKMYTTGEIIDTEEYIKLLTAKLKNKNQAKNLQFKNIKLDDYTTSVIDSLAKQGIAFTRQNIYNELIKQMQDDEIKNIEEIDLEDIEIPMTTVIEFKFLDENGEEFDYSHLPNASEILEDNSEQLETIFNLFVDNFADENNIFSDELTKKITTSLYLGGETDLENLKKIINSLSNEDLKKELNTLWENLKFASDEEMDEILKEIERKLTVYLGTNGFADHPELLSNILDIYLSSHLPAYDVEETTATIMDAVDAINSDIRPAISELGEAYKSIFTEDGFNLKAVNDEMIKGLEDAFGKDFRDELEEFSKVLYNPLSTENDVHTAFNDLVTDYVYASDVLDNLNDTTKDSIVKDFESLGITNAKTVATELLTAKEEALTIAQDNNINSIQKLNDISYDRIKTILDEADATEKTRKYLARLRYEEIMASSKSKGEKTKEISELLAAYGLMSEELSKLYSLIHTYELDEKFGEIETIISDTFDAINNDFDSFLEGFDEDAQEFIRMIKEEIVDKIPDEFKNLGTSIFGISKSILASTGLGLDFETLFGVTDLKVNPNEIDDGKDSTKETEANFDWIETKIEHLSSKAEKEAKKATDSIFAYISKKYKKSHLNSAISFSQEAISATRKGKAYYEKERNKIGLPKEWADKVKYGAIDIDSDELKGKDELIKKIEEYQELTDKINGCTTTIEDLVFNIQEYAEQLANLPIEEAEKKIDKLASKTDILTAQYDNLSSYKAKNKNLDAQYKNKQAETKARETAKNEANTNAWGAFGGLSKYASQGIFTGANKGKGFGDEFSTEGFEVGSETYNSIVKYNEALESSTQAQNDYSLAVENETSLLHDNTKAKYDNIAAHYESLRAISESKVSKADAELAYRDAKGYSNVSEKEQKSLKNKLKNQNNVTNNLKKERKKYDVNKIKQQYENNEIGFDQYTELISYVNELDASILQSQTDALETQKILNEIDLTKIGYQADDARRKLDKFSESLSLKDNVSKNDYKKQINLTSDTITALKKENEELKELQSEVTKHSDLWYEYQDRIDSNDSSIVTLTSDIHELAEEMANLPIEKAEKKIEKLTSKLDILSAKYENLNGYGEKNKNLDEQTQIAKNETKVRKQAKDTAEKNLKDNWNSKLVQQALKTDANKGKKFGEKLSTKGFSKDSDTYKAIVKYNASIEANTKASNDYVLAVENETKVTRDNTKAQYDNISAYRESLRSVREAQVSKAQAYLNYRDAKGWSNTSDGEKEVYQSMLTAQKQVLGNYQEERKKYNQATLDKQYKEGKLSFEDYKALSAYIVQLDENILKAKTDIIATKKVLNEFKLTSLGYQITDTQSKIDKFSNDLALKEKKWGEKAISKENYNSQLSSNKSLITLYQNQNKELTKLRDKTTKYSDLWFEYQEQIDANNSSINDLRMSNEDLKDSIRKIDYRPYENIHKSVEKTITSIETLISLINDDSLFDDEGSLTSLGTAKFASLGKELEQGKKDVKAYIGEINTHKEKIKAYRGGENNGYSEAEYEEDMEKSLSELYSALSKNKSISDAIISMHTQQQQVIIDALKEEISARSEALQKKKEYYDYDKQIRTKTKDIEALEAQKAALEVTEDSLEKRRKLVELEAELTKQREELEETQKDHEINLVVNGLNEFTEDVQERFDDYVKKLSGSFEDQIEIIQNATTMYKNGFTTIAQTFNDILSFYGVDTKNFDVSKLGIPGYATGGVVGGTSYRGDKLIARVNSGESILTQDFTELLPHAVNVMQDLTKVTAPNLNHLVKVQPAINVSYDNLINIEGNATNETIVELKKLMPSITKQVTKSIKDDMKKSGY